MLNHDMTIGVLTYGGEEWTRYRARYYNSQFSTLPNCKIKIRMDRLPSVRLNDGVTFINGRYCPVLVFLTDEYITAVLKNNKNCHMIPS